MLDFLNVIPPAVAGVMAACGGVFAMFFGMALMWDSFFESAHFPWREWMCFILAVAITITGVLSLF